MAQRKKPPFRGDHIGSLLRPEKLLGSRTKLKAGKISAEELRDHENECIREVVKLQESVGLMSITDGEFRRESFHVDFISQIKNVTSSWDFDHVVQLGIDGKAGQDKQMPYIPYINGKMDRPVGGIEVENFKFTSSLTDQTVKVTIPSPTMTHFRGGREAINAEVYPDMEDFFSDLARLYREELSELGSHGCSYVQFDDTNLAYLCDEKMRENARQLGEDPDELPATYAALINDSIRDRPENMSVCIHLCRGNAKGFEPLRFVPEGNKMVVLGLVTTKFNVIESKDELKRRVEEAAKYVDIDQLALSPQCGFSSNAVGNLITVDDQIAKIQLVLETAEEIWG